MKDDRLPDNLRERLWRHQPTAAEEAQFTAASQLSPDIRADWEAEVVLTRALRQLPDVSISSNFTARAMQAARRELERDARRHSWKERWLPPASRWLPRAALASAVVVLGIAGYLRVEQAERVRLVESVSTVSEVASVPSPEILQDFEAIQALNRPPGPDVELLTLLQ